MIKVGISGADTDAAGELIRILLHHPEVEFIYAQSATLKGEPLHVRHHGIYGDTNLKFSNAINLKDIDLLFVADQFPSDFVYEGETANPELRTVALERDFMPTWADPDTTAIALSEIFRKKMVRGARNAYVIEPVAALTLTALYPLAANLLLHKGLKIKVEAPADVISEKRIRKAHAEIVGILGEIQQSFTGEIELTSTATQSEGMEIEAELTNTIDLEEIAKLYDGIYDDHNFTYLTSSKPDLAEVIGTHKCLIQLSKPSEEILRVTAVADPRLRGGAGDAVHAMNLLFGLYEKIGLTFKASKYRK